MKISNWDTWQTFRKDRGTPPWIKVYRNLLSNEQWVELTDSEKGHLVSIWILAADKDGTIPDSPKMIQRMAMLDTLPNLSKFIELGFLSTTCQPHDNQEINPCPQHDAPEKSRVEESRVEKKASSRFTPPVLEEVISYCRERKNNVEANNFLNHYEANGWMRGKNKIKDWKACVRTWESKDNNNQPTQNPTQQKREMPKAGTEE
jgi:hypothetical protein